MSEQNMCFMVRGVKLSYSEKEFGLITGLPFGSIERSKKKLEKMKKMQKKKRKQRLTFKKKYFSRKARIKHDDIKKVFHDIRWSQRDDDDAITMSMLYFIQGNIFEKDKR
ncbi:hypothetical protein M5689_012939 [Euphorbia peplus]|nr:hypothetical protein M5689_012939 [Euphorbia peplus]